MGKILNRIKRYFKEGGRTYIYLDPPGECKSCEFYDTLLCTFTPMLCEFCSGNVKRIESLEDKVKDLSIRIDKQEKATNG